MTDFSNGERVLYIGGFSDDLIGKQGVVVDQPSSDNIEVRFDDAELNDPSGVRGIMPEHLERVAATLTKFAVGTRVTVNGIHDELEFENRQGEVVESDLPANTLIRFDEISDELHTGSGLDGQQRYWYFGDYEDGYYTIEHSTHLNGLDIKFSPPPATDASRPRFMTAWIVDGDDTFSPTGDAFLSLEAAEAFAAETLTNNGREDQIAIFEIRSVHMARLTVTKEVA